ncbi:MAG: hypothetical protein BroJett001_14580 [Chloroflexota bacterium]|nr:MAG: hypothetical protein BroJett001_14580 [Chloroflexota bacterium]
MDAYFRGIKIALFGLLIVYVLYFVFVSSFFELYAKEGRACCLQSDCDFGYTCISIPSPCPKNTAPARNL